MTTMTMTTTMIIIIYGHVCLCVYIIVKLKYGSKQDHMYCIALVNSVLAGCNACLLACNLTFLLASVSCKCALHSYKTVFVKLQTPN
jgi:hypothetical protein